MEIVITVVVLAGLCLFLLTVGLSVVLDLADRDMQKRRKVFKEILANIEEIKAPMPMYKHIVEAYGHEWNTRWGRIILWTKGNSISIFRKDYGMFWICCVPDNAFLFPVSLRVCNKLRDALKARLKEYPQEYISSSLEDDENN